jgi:hypothetical protein
MVVDVLVAADPVLKISDAIDKPSEYLHLTDSILENIEKSKDPVRLNSVICSVALTVRADRSPVSTSRMLDD